MRAIPVSLIGVPTDLGANIRGASMGPEALRVAALPETLGRVGAEVRDCGNLAGPADARATASAASGGGAGLRDGYRHLHEVVAWCRALHDAAGQALADGQTPIVLGGDHSLAIGSISAVAADARRRGRRLRVVWFDSHAGARSLQRDRRAGGRPGRKPVRQEHAAAAASLSDRDAGGCRAHHTLYGTFACVPQRSHEARMSSSTITFGNANPIVNTSAAHLPRWTTRRTPRDSAGVWRVVALHTLHWQSIDSM